MVGCCRCLHLTSLRSQIETAWRNPLLLRGRHFATGSLRNVPEAAATRNIKTRAAPPPASKFRHTSVYSEPPAGVSQSVWVPPPVADGQRSLNVAIVGEPNAGKSTLINALLKKKVSAVSSKYNTTRHRVLGVLTEGKNQICFYDTPGFVREVAGGDRYHKDLVTAAVDAVPESDAVLMLVDVAKRFDDDAKRTLEDVVSLCVQHGSALFLGANKCDLLRGEPLTGEQRELSRTLTAEYAGGGPGTADGRKPNPMHKDLLELKLDIITRWLESTCQRAGILDPIDGFDARHMWIRDLGDGQAPSEPALYRTHNGMKMRSIPSMYKLLPPVHPLSAAHGHGVDRLRASLLDLCLPRAWAYGPTMVTDRPMLEQVAECIREKLFERFHREVPYKIRQETRSWNEVEEPIKGWGAASEHQAAREPATGSEQLRAAHHPRRPTSRITEIHQDIQVPSRSISRMLLANKGEVLKYIAQAASKDVQALLGRRVRLKLHVTIKDPEWMQRQGGGA